MPMSEEAVEGLRAAVVWNPSAARELMNIIRWLPIGVRYKRQDRYGPLGMMLNAGQHVKWVTKDVSVRVQPDPFPKEKLKACEVFNAEWLERRFTKQELADAIERILADIDVGPMLDEVDASTEVIFKASGTFLHKPGSDPLQKIE